ncbi:hypothetical protein BABINDRAFT_160171 [Babjeviella inositovora NRRL Y-12698]|uniref:Uncharacterized protein n=1 Tax=Babjeviella inositovora NRRL Y-12698 TaxID=984486 RepID=A0A1E3QWA4_9ASCO|nr:uncharacterized protein BABINDRAFT_160171 [Babjeviella inositovora NRRL Y-12698]ODQ81953.1 hypothetical protein BABINDRAFT_160171 [Babjeviella inositovora NRRL Y-12698]
MFSDTKKSKTGSRVSPVALDAVLYETDPVTSEGISIDPQSVIHAEWHQEFVARFSATRQAFSSAPLEPVNTILPTTFAGWRSLFFTTDPDMNCVRLLDHQTAIKLVIYATKWLNRSTNASLSRWVLALLVRVPEVLEASDTSYVRHLGLKALKLQGKETSFTAKLTHECVVSIVGDIFRQRDLLDGMERRSQEVIDGSRRG